MIASNRVTTSRRRPAALALAVLSLATLAGSPVLSQDASTHPTRSIGPFADVPAYRVDAARSNVHPGAVPDVAPAVVWSAPMADVIGDRLVIDGLVISSDIAGNVSARDAATGEPGWSFVGASPLGTMIAGDGVLVVPDAKGTIHALDASTGDVRWQADTVPSSTSAVATTDAEVLVADGQGTIRAFDLATGEERGVWQTPGATTSLTVVDGIAYVGTMDGVIVAIDLADGRELWPEVRLLSNEPGSMPLVDGVLFASSIQNPGEPVGEVIAIDAANGEVLWRFRTPSGRQVGPATVEGGVVYAGSERDGLYALDATTGDVRWHVDMPTTYSPVAIADGLLLVSVGDGTLRAVDPADGNERWQVLHGGGPVVSGGLLFVTLAETLTALGEPGIAPASQPPSTPEPTANAQQVLQLVETWDATRIEGLDHPCYGDLAPDGNLVFVNCGTSEVIMVSPDGLVVRRWGGPGSKDGEFDFLRDRADPWSAIGGAAVGPDGSVFVTDTENHRIQRFTQEGGYVGSFGSYGDGDGAFLEPFDVDAGPDGSVYVVDDVRDDIQRFTAEGEWIQTIGEHGTGDGQLNYTGSVLTTPDGTLINADFNNNRIQAWDADGEWLWNLGGRGAGIGQLRTPSDLAVDTAGRLYVTEFDNHRIQVFGPDRSSLGEWRYPSNADIDLANGLVAGPGRLYVMNSFGDRIWVLEPTFGD